MLIPAGVTFASQDPQPAQDSSAAFSSSPGVSPSPLFETKEWVGLVNGYPGGISLRNGLGRSLLLKHNNGGIIYRYDATSGELQLVGDDAWLQATSDIANSNQPASPDHGRSYIDRQTNTLHIDDKEVPGVAGKVHLWFRFSPTGKRLAVLSADGRKSLSLLPFWGEGGASGKHYHQIFSYPDLAPQGAPVELPFTTERTTFSSCWSADERYVVYIDPIYSKVAIVSIAPQPGRKPE